MFYPTAQSCCDRFFFGRECVIYDTDCYVSDSEPGGPGPSPTPDDTPSSTSNTGFYEDFEAGLNPIFTTEGLPWKINDEYAYKGSRSIANSPTGQNQSSKLKLSMDFQTDGVLVYELRHDVFMPFAELMVTVDGKSVVEFRGHDGDPQWGTQKISITKGLHEIVWDVLTDDHVLPPTPKGSGTVWIDNVRFGGAKGLTLDFEDGEFNEEAVSFSGIGKWRIDDSQPGAKTGVAAHSPKGLMPSEFSTMEVRRLLPVGGTVSSDIHLALGTISFYVNDKLEYTLGRPGSGTKNVEVAVGPGDYTFSWKYEPPGRAGMPMAMVWVDNIMIY